jgi:hypothetical protein
VYSSTHGNVNSDVIINNIILLVLKQRRLQVVSLEHSSTPRALAKMLKQGEGVLSHLPTTFQSLINIKKKKLFRGFANANFSGGACFQPPPPPLGRAMNWDIEEVTVSVIVIVKSSPYHFKYGRCLDGQNDINCKINMQSSYKYT